MSIIRERRWSSPVLNARGPEERITTSRSGTCSWIQVGTIRKAQVDGTRPVTTCRHRRSVQMICPSLNSTSTWALMPVPGLVVYARWRARGCRWRGPGCAADGATWNSGSDSGGVGAWNRGVRTALDQALVGDFHEGVWDQLRESWDENESSLLGREGCLQGAPRGLFVDVTAVMGT